MSGRRFPRDGRWPKPRVANAPVLWTPSDIPGNYWYDSDHTTNTGAFGAVTAAAQQNPALGALDLISEPTSPIFNPSAAFFNGRPAVLSPGSEGSLRLPASFPQPSTVWMVVAFGDNGWFLDAHGANTGMRLDTGIGWVINAPGFSFGVESGFAPSLAYGAAYFLSIDFNGAATALYVGTTLQSLNPGIVASPDLDNLCLGGIGSVNDFAWGAWGVVLGGMSAPNRALGAAWSAGLYGSV